MQILEHAKLATLTQVLLCAYCGRALHSGRHPGDCAGGVPDTRAGGGGIPGRYLYDPQGRRWDVDVRRSCHEPSEAEPGSPVVMATSYVGICVRCDQLHDMHVCLACYATLPRRVGRWAPRLIPYDTYADKPDPKGKPPMVTLRLRHCWFLRVDYVDGCHAVGPVRHSYAYGHILLCPACARVALACAEVKHVSRCRICQAGGVMAEDVAGDSLYVAIDERV